MRVREDRLTEIVIRAIIRVHSVLGPGFREKIYGRALIIELAQSDITVEMEKEFPIYYEGRKIGTHFVDFIVAGKVIVELKTVENLGKEHYAQLRSYLRASGLETGLLVNFAAPRADYRRISIPLHPPIS